MSWIESLCRRFFFEPPSRYAMQQLESDTLGLAGISSKKLQPQLGGANRPDAKAVRSSLQFLRSVLASEIKDGQDIKLKATLWLTRTRLRWLPGSLEVQGDLLLNGCQRFRGFAGRSLRVHGDLFIGGSGGSLWLGDEEILQRSYGRRVSEFLQSPSLESTCPLEALPDEVQVDGDLSLVNCPSCQTLPSVLGVGGNVTLVNCGIQYLPEDMKVRGNLVLDGCSLERLPERLQVEGNLTLANTHLEALPFHLRVGGNLRISNCQELALIPGSISVGRSLAVIGGRSLEHLSPNLKVGKNLILKRCSIERLELPGCSGLSVIDCKSLRSIESIHALTLNELRIQRWRRIGIDCKRIEDRRRKRFAEPAQTQIAAS